MADLDLVVFDEPYLLTQVDEETAEAGYSSLEDYVLALISQNQAQTIVSRYQTTFIDSDLTIAGILVRQHNLNRMPMAIAVFDSSGEAVGIRKIEALTSNTIAISLDDFRPLKTGNWTLIVGA